MRCLACNTELNVFECRAKDPQTDDYLDLCSTCATESYKAMDDGLGFKWDVGVDEED